MSKTLTDKQIKAKRENDRERKSTGFMLKQRAFLHLQMITMTEEKRLYGLTLLKELKNEFESFGYIPQSSEVYKALHDLIDEGILEQVVERLKGKQRQKVVYYRFVNRAKAESYKETLIEELKRCHSLLEKAIEDNTGKSKRKLSARR